MESILSSTMYMQRVVAFLYAVSCWHFCNLTSICRKPSACFGLRMGMVPKVYQRNAIESLIYCQGNVRSPSQVDIKLQNISSAAAYILQKYHMYYQVCNKGHVAMTTKYKDCLYLPQGTSQKGMLKILPI
jgi:hypothetical protein